MLSMLSLLAVFISLPAIVPSEPSSSPTESICRNLDDVDRCAQRVGIYGDPEYRFGQSPDEVLSNCRTDDEAEKCVREYVRKCLKSPLIRQYIGMFLKGPSKLRKKSCSPAGIKVIISHYDCLNRSKDPLDQCVRQALIDTYRISKADDKIFLQASCCLASQSKECIDQAISNTCTGDSLEYMVRETKSFQGDAFDFLCGSEFDHKNMKCLKVMEQMPIIDFKQEKVPRSIFPISLKLMTKFFS